MLLKSISPIHAGRLLTWAWVLVAALPCGYIVACVIDASRNIAFQDELDTAIQLLLHLDEGAGWKDFLRQIFAISNEHRIATSRLLFAASYWLTGTVNFHAIGAIGNLFIVAACAILVATAGTTARRVRLGVILAFLTFQLGNFENFLWSGASIDHFQVVMLAVGAFALGARPSRLALAGALLLATLATFTLAHGGSVWPIGLLMLALAQRWRRLGVWCLAMVIVLAAYLHGFQANPGHRLPELSPATLARVVEYWLTLLGAPLAFGQATLGVMLGAALLGGLVFFAWTRVWAREPVLVPTILFALLSLALVAYGRAAIADGQVASRYMVLGTLAWALLLFLVLEALGTPTHPYRALLWSLPGLAAFNVASNLVYESPATIFIEARDRAALRFKQYEVDGRGQTRLHPQQGHADALLKAAAARGIYSLPRLCFEVSFPAATISKNMVTYVDENMVTASAVSLGGWAMRPGHESQRGQIHVILRSATRQLIFTTIAVARADVARAYKQPGWRDGGFRFVLRREHLPVDDYQVGLLIDDGAQGEYVMTDQWVRLAHPIPGAPVRFNTL